MSRRRPEPRTLEVRSLVGVRRRTRSGNWYLRCETNQGVAVFWGSDGNLHNISRIEGTRPPFRVTCGCLASNWSADELWVPEGSALEMHASGDTRPPGKGVTDAPQRVSPVRITRKDDRTAPLSRSRRLRFALRPEVRSMEESAAVHGVPSQAAPPAGVRPKSPPPAPASRSATRSGWYGAWT